MEREFARGATAYVVERAERMEPRGPLSLPWRKRSAEIRSAGKKYVTVIDEGRMRRFMAAEKPVLQSEKPGAFLVGTSERAQKLIDRLTSTTTP